MEREIEKEYKEEAFGVLDIVFCFVCFLNGKN